MTAVESDLTKESDLTIESLRCSSCLSKFVRCSTCKTEELRFNDKWQTVCRNDTCSNKGKVGSMLQTDEIAVCKTCRSNYGCRIDACNEIAKRKCQKCPRFIGLCDAHNMIGSRHHVDMCESCELKYCDKCGLMQNYQTASCDSCGLRQCNKCFDFKDEIHDGRILSYVCLLCQPESERDVCPHNVLLTVDLDRCFESYPSQYPCKVKVRSGTVVETLMMENVIREMMAKARERGAVSPFIEANWQQICDQCEE